MPDPAGGKAAIDALRSADGSLTRKALRSVLPYGEDFFFLNSVSKLTDAEVEAHYDIPADSIWLRSHFEGFPLMPGALIAEGFAQAGTLVVRYNLDDPRDKLVLAMELEKARFDAPAFPGDALTYAVRLRTMSRRAARLEGEVRVGDRRIGRLRLVVGISDRSAYAEKARRRNAPAGGSRPTATNAPRGAEKA